MRRFFAKETGAAVFCTKKMIIINVWLVCAFACVAVPVGGGGEKEEGGGVKVETGKGN